jgi:hypothetical protein
MRTDGGETPAPDPRLSRGSNFGRALRTALDLFDKPHLAVVAATLRRAEYIGSLCARSGIPPQKTTYFTSAAAGSGLRTEPHQIVVLDASVETARRILLREIARKKVPGCRVVEIKSWMEQPPL